VTKEITGLALQGREEISNTPSPLMGFVRISNVTFTLLSRLYLFYFILLLKGKFTVLLLILFIQVSYK